MNVYRHYGLAHCICTEAINIFKFTPAILNKTKIGRMKMKAN